MAIITEARIDLADCHTTLYYFDQAPEKPRLPLAMPEKYIELHRKAESVPQLAYDDAAAPGNPALFLKSLSPAYHKNKYWDRVTGNDDFEMYSGRAWERIIPLAARLKPRVEFSVEYMPGIKVSPIPRVLIYPFGWSAWLSLRVTGKFEIEALAKFLPFILETKVFKIIDENDVAEPELYTVRDLFRSFAKGVRNDAFAGKDTDDYNSNGLIGVTTVMAKYQGSVPADMFENDPTLLRIVKPEGTPPGNAPEYYGVKRGDFEYILAHEDMRFIWFESLMKFLKYEGKNYSRLGCYHNNNFLSMVQARHLLNMQAIATKRKNPSVQMTEMLDNAKNFFDMAPYKNAGLKKFLIDNGIFKSPTPHGREKESGSEGKEPAESPKW
jgi:hypothetical protein